MKKEGIRQILFYSNDKSPVPNEILYYDENGFISRELSLDWYPSDDPQYNYLLVDYDRWGRVVRSVSGTYSGTSAEDIHFLNENKMSTTWNYANDSLLIQTDSVFYGRRLANITQKTTVTHWKKNNLPSKKYRPIFLTDSFPEREKTIETVYHYYYQSEEISENDEPVKTDSTFSELNVSWTVDSSRMSGNYNWERHNGDTIEQWETKRTYTLNQYLDTITWENYSWINLPTTEEKLQGLDNLHYISIQAFCTKRKLHGYVVYIYPDYYKHVQHAEGNTHPQKLKTKDPWHEYQLQVFYLEEFQPEDYTLEFFKKRYSPKKIVMVKAFSK